GVGAAAAAPAPGAARPRTWAGSAALRSAGGTDQILRNVIAERVLGLPEEIRLDKGLPFNEVPR
ncbi:MAG: acyl-CoA dehydrogenase, partial [Pseudomonadota bacterium]